MKRRLAVILMADMVDYTRLMEADQMGTIALVRDLRERWLEPEAERRGGEVLKRLGDGWIISFDSVTDAVETAQSVQAALSGHDRLQLRIAVHLGEITSDGEDFYGTGVNVAARLQAEAPPGGVMISDDLSRQLDSTLAETFTDAGSFRLKNIAGPVSAFQWRPAPRTVRQEDVPVIGVETVAASPASAETLEAASDLQEQLIHYLSRRTGIRVLAIDPEHDNEATYALRCRLRSHGERARVTATLILREDGQVTWSRMFEDDAEDLFRLTDTAAEHLSDALRLQINAFDGERLADLPDQQLSPSELRTRAAMLFYRATIADYQHADALLERALRLDPDNPTSLAMWCEAKLDVNEAQYLSAGPEFRDQLAAAADRAVQLAPRTDYVWYVRAHVRARLLGDIEGARKDVQRLTRLNPGYVLGMEAKGYTEFFAGNWDDACAAFTEAAERSVDDPFLAFRLYPLAIAHMLAGRPDDALIAIGEATELRPSCRAYWLVNAWVLKAVGRTEEADRAHATADSVAGGPELLVQNLHLPDDIRQAIGLPEDAPINA